MRMFTEFFQVRPDKLQGGKGTGLGLYSKSLVYSFILCDLHFNRVTVTKGIVDLHGGTLSVRSDGEGYGTTFELVLPVYRRQAIFSRDGSKKSLFSVRSSTNNEVTTLVSVRRPAGLASMRSHSSSGRNSSNRSSMNRMQVQSVHSFDFDADKDRDDDSFASRSRPVLPSATPIFTILEHCPQSSGSILINGSGSFGYDVNKPEDKEEVTRDSSNLGDYLRVLIVDDAKMNRKMLCRLIKYRCDVTMEAEDGQRAVEEVASAMARGEPFNCILMDFNMPRKDGPTAAREIRSMGYTGMIIGITGCTTPGERDIFISSGADCVLTKPVDLHELDRTIVGMRNEPQYFMNYLCFTHLSFLELLCPTIAQDLEAM